MIFLRLKRSLLVVVVLLLCDYAQAGLSNAGAGETRFTTEQVIRFSKKIEKVLGEKGAYVAIVARMGRPASELPPGMRFTHAGFAVYSEITTRDGRKLPGYAMFNLYQNSDKPDTSHLAQDFPVDFFASAYEMEAGVLIPSAELQRRLLELIGTPTYHSLHNPHYSAIANPYTLPYQNCTEFVLDVVNAAIYESGDIGKLKAATHRYFKAQSVNVAPLKLAFGAMFSKEIAISDHTGKPETATFETIANYLLRYDNGSELLAVKYDENDETPALAAPPPDTYDATTQP